jgi:DNA-binding transcriptional LysR family regulator
MNISNIDWNLLKSFFAVMEAGSLLGAAKKTGGHQPTLSRHINELEEKLGVVLFERTGRGLKPTVIAHQIVPLVCEMSLSSQKIAFSIMQSKQSLRGTVRISCSQVMAAFLMPKLIIEFRKLHPNIQIELVSTNQVSNLLNREADIALRFIRPAQTSLIARKLCHLSFGAYATPAYLSSVEKDIDRDGYLGIAEIFQFDVVGLDKDLSLIQVLSASGVDVNRDIFAFRTDDHVAGIHLVAQDGGIGFMPAYVAAQLKGLQSVLGESLQQSLPMWLVTHRELNGAPLIRLVYDFLAMAIPREIDPGRTGAGTA